MRVDETALLTGLVVVCQLLLCPLQNQVSQNTQAKSTHTHVFAIKSTNKSHLFRKNKKKKNFQAKTKQISKVSNLSRT